MNFAFPLFLWALTALAIPIIVHLFNFRKTKRILFSNTRFLFQVKQETTQKRRLKQYLILASRLLFIFFLVMAFAQPFLPAREQLGAGREIILYIDNSYSMISQVGEKVRALDAGIRFAKEIVTMLPSDTRYKLLTNDFAPFSNTYKTKTETLDGLTQIRLSPISRSFHDVHERVGGGLEDVFWISDFQKSTLGVVNLEKGDSVRPWRLVPIELESESNIFIDSAYLEDPFIVGGQRNTLNVSIRNMGAKAHEDLVLRLTINDIQSGTASVNLQSNSSAVAKFDLVQGLQGWNRAVVSFTDFPVSFDNEFFLTLNFSDKINIVEVTGGVESNIEKVFGNSGLFTFRKFNQGNVDMAVLNGADLVVIHGVENPDAPLMDALKTYQFEQGTLLIIPSDKIKLSAYQPILPGLGITKIESKEQLELDKPDFQNPFFENVFEERTTSLAMPRAKPVLEWSNDRSALLKFKNEKPFLSKTGKTFLMAAPIDSKFSDFQNHALFVPVMYRIAASGHRISQKPYYSLTESAVTLATDSLLGETPVKLKGKQEVIPAQRRTGDRLILEIPRFSIDPGFYFAMNNLDTLGLVAFDIDQRESFLDQWTGPEVESLMGSGKNIALFDAAATDSFSNEIKARYLGTPLWKYALLAALFFLLAEAMLIRFLK